MSMAIKLLVELNAEKHTILIDTDFKFVKFKKVSNEIITQLNENISHKTHSFELFDEDFNEYVLVNNDNQLIHNLSRIRVKTKDTTSLRDENLIESAAKKLNDMSISDKPLVKPSDNNDKELNQFYDFLFGNNNNNSTENNKVVAKQRSGGTSPLNDFIKNHLSEKTKDLDKYLFNYSDSPEKLVNKEINVNKMMGTTHMNTESTIDKFLEASNMQTLGNGSTKPDEEAINYLDVEESNEYILSASCSHLYHKTYVEEYKKQPIVVIRFRFEDFKAIHTLLESLNINRQYFQKNPLNGNPSNSKWEMVSVQMINNGFNEWTADKCRNAFNNALDLYRKSLERCPDYEIAVKVNPLFVGLHAFDMKFIITIQEFTEIKELRELFSRFRRSKFGQKSGFSQRNFTFNQLTAQKSSAIGSPPKHIENVFKDSPELNAKIDSLFKSLDDKNGVKNSSQIDKIKLKKIKLKIDNQLILTFKALAKCVDKISAKFGPGERNIYYWELVSNEMKAIGYTTYSAQDYYQMFTEHICDYYSLTLNYSSDVITAKEVYPLFDFIHTLDLSKCLSTHSFDKINDLRKKFEKKSQFFNQMFE